MFQCSSGTRACLTKVNVKENEPDRIMAVIPIAQSSHLDPSSSLSHGTLLCPSGCYRLLIHVLQNRNHCHFNYTGLYILIPQYGNL